MNNKTIIHPVTGVLKELSQEDFLALFSEPIHQEILKKAHQPGVDMVVSFEILAEEFDFPKARTAVNFGPLCSYQVDRIAKGCRLGTTLDDIKYPTAFWRVPSPHVTAEPSHSTPGWRNRV